MHIVATGDFHGVAYPEIPPCDLLLFAGDIGARTTRDFDKFSAWLQGVPAEEIIGIAGNVDDYSDRKRLESLPWTYLLNEGCVYGNVPVWGSPYWNTEEIEPQMHRLWDTIPNDTQILLVHGPPHGLCDLAFNGDRAGSRSLRAKIDELPDLRYVVCGHIHEAYGRARINDHAVCFNVAAIHGGQPAEWEM